MVVSGNASDARLSHEAANAGTVRHARATMLFIAGASKSPQYTLSERPGIELPLQRQLPGSGLNYFASLLSEATAVPASSANAARSSFSLGGLLSTRSTSGGTSPSAISRCPQPVKRITGVDGESFLMAL